MFQKTAQKLQSREGMMLLGSIALVCAMFALLGLGVYAFTKSDSDNQAGSAGTITVTGNGETFAVPDIAEFTVTLQKDASTMADAQTQVAVDGNALIAALKNAGVAEKDIQTQGFNAFPKYENKPVSLRPCSAIDCPPVDTNPVIVGYTVSHTYAVKVRDLSKVGDIAKLITDANVFSVSGPDFTVDDINAVNNQARDKAIADAKTQATILAHQLGVHLKKIVDFQVMNGGGNYPIYAKAMSADAGMSTAPSPTLEPGQTDVKVQVQITYKI